VLARPSSEMGRMLRYDGAGDDYIRRMEELIPTCLSGKKIALSCSGSCVSVTAERLFTGLGAEVMILPETDGSFDPDIEMASTSLERLMEFVPANGCDCGFEFDNEGFGCFAVDETGKLTDGDSLLAIFAKFYKEREKLRGNTIVVNYMSGLGLLNFARDNGINVLTSGAGDRYILDRMTEEECSLGGERSGHIIFLDDCPVGDGQLCAARLTEIMKITGKKLSELAGEMQKLPQIVLNVRISPRKREIWKNDSIITGLIKESAEKLGAGGRVIVREAYGADPFIRVVIEGGDFGTINEMAMDIARTIKARCA